MKTGSEETPSERKDLTSAYHCQILENGHKRSPQNCPTPRKCFNWSSVSYIKGHYWKRAVLKMNLAL